VLEPGGETKIKELLKANPGAAAFSFRILYLWNSRTQIRVDGIYGPYARPRLFKLLGNYSFRRTGVNGNLHCACIPAALLMMCQKSQVALHHLGYMEKEDRIRKWKFYNKLDSVNAAEGYEAAHPERGSYPHIVQGDIPEVPVNVRLKHAGPLKLRAI
jgi:hypothetical protein